jgi:opine dehydrogenase
MIERVAVLGAGNGGCAAAADLGNRGFEVRLYNRSAERLAPLRERGGLEMIGACGDGFVTLDVITDDIEEAVTGADLVMVAVPISAHPFYAAEIAPVLSVDQVLFLNPGQMGGGLYMVHEIHRLTGRTDIRSCEVSTLAYACRMKGPATVNIHRMMAQLPFAAFPGRHQAELFGLLQPIFPTIVETRDVLESGFLDINAVEHPPQIICNAGWLEHTKGDYLFYYEGTTPSVGKVIDGLDRERMAVAEAAGVPTRPFVDVFADMGYTTHEAAQEGRAYAALQDSAPNRWLKGPPTLDHRYINEDVGWGLVPWSEMGRAYGVPTPVMDALITIGSTLNGKDYRRDGLTLARVGLEGIPQEELASYLWEGIR